ncbi:MAG: hypothetical protein MUC58_10375 [Rhizobiaceae bacterium]|nr:hypothetical protein [Rhizobiaceae bacterium]
MLARLFVAVGGVLAAALLAALIAPWFIDWTNWRADFEREASRIIGQRVTVGGTADARLIPFPSVTFTEVTVDGPDGLPAARIARFSMDAELAPFLSGDVVIFDMRIDEPDIRLRLDAGGGLNWPLPERSGFDPSSVSLETVTITGGRVLLERPAGAPLLLTALEAVLSARSLAGPWQGRGSADVNGVRVRAEMSASAAADGGGARLSLALETDAAPAALRLEGRVETEEGAPRWTGDATLDIHSGAVGAQPARIARMRGPFILDVEGLAIRDAQVTLGADGSPDTYNANGAVSVDWGAAPAFSIDLKGQQIRIDAPSAGDGGATAGKSDRVSERAALGTAVNRLLATAANVPRPPLPGTVSLNLPAIVVGETTVTNIALQASVTDGVWSIAAASAELPGRTVVEVQGVLDAVPPAFRGTITAATRQPTGLAAWLGLPAAPAVRTLAGAGFSARADISAARQVLRDLELQLGDARFTGLVDRRAPGSGQPFAGVQLSGHLADLDLLGPVALAILAAAPDHGFELTLDAATVRLDGLQAAGLSAEVTAGNGLIRMNSIRLDDFAGMQIAASGTWRQADPWPDLRLRMTAEDPLPALEVLAGRLPAQPWLADMRERLALAPETAAGLAADVTLGIDEGGQVLVVHEGSTAAAEFAGRMRLAQRAGPVSQAQGRIVLQSAETALALAGVPVLPLGDLAQVTADYDLAFDRVTPAATGAWTGRIGFVDANGGRLALSRPVADAEARLELDVADIEPYALAAGAGLPGGGLGLPVSLVAGLRQTGPDIALNAIEARIADVPVTGNLTLADLLATATTRTRISGALAVGELELGSVTDALLAPLPFAAIDLTLTARSVFVGALGVISNAGARITGTEAGLRIDDIAADAAGGRVSATADIVPGAGGALVSLSGQLAGADLAQLSPVLSGSGEVQFQVSGQGADSATLAASFSGSAIAQGHGVMLVGFDATRLDAMQTVLDADGTSVSRERVETIARSQLLSGRTPPFDHISAFTIAGGVARAPLVSVQLASGGAVSIAPEVNLSSGVARLEGELVAAVPEQSASVLNPAIGYLVEGPLDAPALTMDFTALHSFFTQRALEREEARVQAMQSALIERQRLRRENRHFAALIASRRAADEARRAAEQAMREAAQKAADSAGEISVQEGAPQLQPPPAPIPSEGSIDELLRRLGSRPLTP